MDCVHTFADLQHRKPQLVNRRVEVRAKFLEGGYEGLLDTSFKVAVRQLLQPRSDLVNGADTFSNVGRELGYFRDLIVKIEDRIVGGLDPNFLSTLADTLEFGSERIRRGSAFSRNPDSQGIARKTAQREGDGAAPQFLRGDNQEHLENSRLRK